ncbi:MAG: transposase family protein [Caldilineaceae bacterium SB0665_bin_21]|nr:transposase family protein [Caldilineaceae bacterium SB0665_bin_21]MYA04051.1 transposase family protein [Caldilineaceae bacterium SB0664_bin_22]MYC61977.1 transposase family protein [Caldilineaceae bacterium SB0661_bin_34]
MDGLMPSPWSRPWHPRGPRVDRIQWHHLTNMLVVAVLAAICGADSFEAVALFDQRNEAGLLAVQELPHGIPSHNTLERICARRDAARMKEDFRDRVQDIFAPTTSQAVVIAFGTL